MKKNVLCEKGDEITRFDGTQYKHPTMWCNLHIQEVHLKNCNSVDYSYLGSY